MGEQDLDYQWQAPLALGAVVGEQHNWKAAGSAVVTRYEGSVAVACVCNT